MALEPVPELLDTMQHLFLLEDPTFGAAMEFYEHIGAALAGSLHLTASLWVHGLAKAHAATISYTDTVEALWTALAHVSTPPESEDWRMWALLDRLGVTEQDLQAVVVGARSAVAEGKHLVCMTTPANLPQLLQRKRMRVVFLQTAPAVREQYSVSELAGSLYPKFKDSVVGGWQGISAPKRSWFGARRFMQMPAGILG